MTTQGGTGLCAALASVARLPIAARRRARSCTASRSSSLGSLHSTTILLRSLRQLRQYPVGELAEQVLRRELPEARTSEGPLRPTGFFTYTRTVGS